LAQSLKVENNITPDFHDRKRDEVARKAKDEKSTLLR
jgi:hypothetical protein